MEITGNKVFPPEIGVREPARGMEFPMLVIRLNGRVRVRIPMSVYMQVPPFVRMCLYSVSDDVCPGCFGYVFYLTEANWDRIAESIRAALYPRFPLFSAN